MAREKSFGLAEILALLIALGLLLTLVAGIINLWSDPNLTAVWKVILISLLVLFLMVLISVTWERLKARSKEKFKEVEW